MKSNRDLRRSQIAVDHGISENSQLAQNLVVFPHRSPIKRLQDRILDSVALTAGLRRACEEIPGDCSSDACQKATLSASTREPLGRPSISPESSWCRDRETITGIGATKSSLRMKREVSREQPAHSRTVIQAYCGTVCRIVWGDSGKGWSSRYSVS